MARTSIVIKLLLLVIVTGNIALVAVNHVPLVDVGAVAEWRYGCEPGDTAPGGDSDMPAALTIQQEFTLTFTTGEMPSLGRCFTAVAVALTPATRAPPPFAAPA